MSRLQTTIATFLLGLSTYGARATADTLYVVDSASHLLKVDVLTSRVDEVLSTEAQFSDITFAPDGRLYGVTRDYLYEIDPATGWGTLIGAHGYGGINSPYGIDSLTSGSGGILYAAGNNILISIDPSTGAGAKVGALSGYLSAGDLAVDGKGRLLLTTDFGVLVEVSTSGGGAKPLGRLPYNDIYALAIDADGTLYGLRSTNEILRIDPDKCLAVTLGTLHADTLIGRAWGAAFPVARLPEPAAVLLLILGAPMMRLARREVSKSG